MTNLVPAALNARQRCILSAAALLSVVWWQPASAASLLNSAQDFAVIGATTVTNTGSTQIYGELGVSPGSAVTGFGPGLISSGSIHSADALTSLAQIDATAAYNALGVPDPMLPVVNLSGQILGSSGLSGFASLTPGIYSFASSASVLGTLTLDFGTNPTGSFVFLIGSALETGSGSSVNVLNGGEFSSIYWRVGSSATLGTGTDFAGNILANNSITLNTGAEILGGRAIALTGAVTMDASGVSTNCSFGGCSSPTSDFGSDGFSGLMTSPVPEPASAWMLAAGLLALRLVRVNRRKASGSGIGSST